MHLSRWLVAGGGPIIEADTPPNPGSGPLPVLNPAFAVIPLLARGWCQGDQSQSGFFCWRSPER